MTEVNRREFGALAAITGVAAASGAALAPGSAAAQGDTNAQAPGFYRWKVGDMVVTAIHDGFAPRQLEGFVRGVDLAEVRRVAEAAFLPTDAFQNTFTSLIVQAGGRTILIDTGLGEFAPPTAGAWLANFRAAGFDPARVDQILISHFHGDHIGGIRNRDGNLRFPNAEIVVPAPEWDFWMSDERMAAAPEAARGGFQNARRVFAPMAAQVKRITPGAEVAPGITSIAAHGHSPGHTMYLLQSGQAKLLFVADITSHPALFAARPDWAAVFDMDPAMAVASRRRVLDMAASERMRLAFYHAPFPATGFIAREGDGYRYVPVQWSNAL